MNCGKVENEPAESFDGRDPCSNDSTNMLCTCVVRNRLFDLLFCFVVVFAEEELESAEPLAWTQQLGPSGLLGCVFMTPNWTVIVELDWPTLACS